mgnify:FL=1
MATEESKDQKITEAPITTESEGKPVRLEERTNTEFKLGQLEVLVGALKEKVDGHIELKKWFIVALVTIFGIIVAIVVGATNLMNGNLTAQREIQKDYYQLLIQDKTEINSYITNLEKNNGCLQKNYYWDYKNCILNNK